MRLFVYYRKPDGSISHHQKVPDDWSREKLVDTMNEFNRDHRDKGERSREAVLVEVEDGSFEAYLLDALAEKLKYPKEAIRDALDAIDSARSAIEDLEAET